MGVSVAASGRLRRAMVRIFPASGAARLLPLLTLLFFASLAAALASGAAANARKQAAGIQNGDNRGLFLIARPGLGDPFFTKSTVVMLPLENSELVVGVIINKPTRVPLSELFPHARSLEKQSATAYFGGPVDTHDLSAIFRSANPSEHALHLFADVYITFDADEITSLVKNSKQPSSLRIFLGRAQWGQAQLQREMMGAWYSVRLNADPIFSADPGKVWKELLARAAPRPDVEYRQPRDWSPRRQIVLASFRKSRL